MIKHIAEKVVLLVAAALIIWFLWSWVDILMHNDPFMDHQYSPYNLLIHIVDWRMSWV